MPRQLDLGKQMPDVRHIREQLGLSQAEFGARVGVQQTTVSHWEQRLRRPSRAAIILIEQLAEKLSPKNAPVKK